MDPKAVSVEDPAGARPLAARPEDTVTAGEFLRLVRARAHRFTDEEAARVEDLKRDDQPPSEKD